MTDGPKRGPGRPRKATPIPTKEGHSARVWVEREGEVVRATVKLGTKSKLVANARKRRLLAGEMPELLAEKSESFRAAAERILEASAAKNKKNILGQLRKYAFPVIGGMPVSEVTSVHILDVLADVEGVLGWTGTVKNVRDAVSMVLRVLVERRVLDVNEAQRIKFRSKDGSLGGKRIRKVRPPRVVLTDEEFERLIAWLVAEVEEGGRWAASSLELLMLCLGARIFGMRMSDLHAWVWEMIDTVDWADAYVPRPKTDAALLDDADDAEGVIFEEWRDEPRTRVPEPFARWLSLWWERHGRPETGPVFICRRGPRAGLTKQVSGYVKPLKAALWRAGISRPQPGFDEAETDAERRALCALQSGIPRRRSPIDFHSFRRASATAAGNAVASGQLSLREAMLLTHHKDPAVFARYQARAERIVVPESAIPTIMAAPPALFQVANHGPQPNQAAAEKKEGRVASARTTPSPHDQVNSRELSHTTESRIDVVAPGDTTQRQNPLPVIGPALTLTDEALSDLLALATKAKRWDLTQAISAQLESLAAATPPNVTSLDAARKRRDDGASK
jgi:integrase